MVIIAHCTAARQGQGREERSGVRSMTRLGKVQMGPKLLVGDAFICMSSGTAYFSVPRGAAAAAAAAAAGHLGHT